jgi:hypothetical protein
MLNVEAFTLEVTVYLRLLRTEQVEWFVSATTRSNK